MAGLGQQVELLARSAAKDSLRAEQTGNVKDVAKSINGICLALMSVGMAQCQQHDMLVEIRDLLKKR